MKNIIGLNKVIRTLVKNFNYPKINIDNFRSPSIESSKEKSIKNIDNMITEYNKSPKKEISSHRKDKG